MGSFEDRLLVAILGVLFVFSIGVPVYEQLSGNPVPASWNAPVVLLTLFAIMRLVGPLPQIGKDVTYLREVADVSVQRMSTQPEFYDSLVAGLRKANKTVDLTHIRDHPPNQFGPGADQFFREVLNWCTEHKEGSVRRIITVRSSAMHVWARQLAEEIEQIPQFEVRVVEWAPEAPAINLAILDEQAVYLALTGEDARRTQGLGIEDRKEITAQYFHAYFNDLWRKSVDLRDWLERNTTEGGWVRPSAQQVRPHLRLEGSQ